MKVIIRETNGKKQAYHVPDSFDENTGDISVAIPIQRPTLDNLNWGHVREEVINALVEAQIYSLNDLRTNAKHRVLSAKLAAILLDVVSTHFVETN